MKEAEYDEVDAEIRIPKPKEQEIKELKKRIVIKAKPEKNIKYFSR